MRRRTAIGLTAALALGLAGAKAATALAQPTAPAAADCPERLGRSLPAGWSERRKAVHLAVCEWSRFGAPVIEIRPGEGRALPSALGLSAPLSQAAGRPPAGYEAVTPAAEVQTRFGRTESDPSASAAIERYWAGVRPAYVDSIRRARRQAASPSLYPGWWDPWSGAFVSWVMRGAGVAWFSPSASHVQYLKAAMAARPGQVRPITGYRPLPGDLICAPRADAAGRPTAVSVSAFMEALASGVDHFETHCDVVVRVNRTSVVSIGGNVKNTVAATVTPLRSGRLMRTEARPWAAALTLGEPYDPCARIESAPLKGWEGQGAERKRALARTGCRAP